MIFPLKTMKLAEMLLADCKAAGLRIAARKLNAAPNDIDRMTTPRTMADKIRRP